MPNPLPRITTPLPTHLAAVTLMRDSTDLGGVLVASTLGTPGTATCMGQSAATLAQIGAPYGYYGFDGIADYNSLTTQQLHDYLVAYCGA